MTPDARPFDNAHIHPADPDSTSRHAPLGETPPGSQTAGLNRTPEHESAATPSNSRRRFLALAGGISGAGVHSGVDVR